MIEIVVAAAAGAVLVLLFDAMVLRPRSRAARDEQAQVIAMGECMGIEHVPGENFTNYRARVCAARDDRALAYTARENAAIRRGKKGVDL